MFEGRLFDNLISWVSHLATMRFNPFFNRKKKHDSPHEHKVFGMIKVPYQIYQKGRVIMRTNLNEIQKVIKTHG